MKYAIASAVALAVAGCGVGVSRDPVPGSTSLEGSNPDGGAEPSAPSCSSPHGPLHVFDTQAELDQLILGRWRLCEGKSIAYLRGDGIEFTSDGVWFRLDTDAQGQLVRATADDGRGTWDAYGPRGIKWGGNGGSPEFEDNPRRFRFVDTAAISGPIVYVEAP
jgi:hypothetical protein